MRKLILLVVLGLVGLGGGVGTGVLLRPAEDVANPCGNADTASGTTAGTETGGADKGGQTGAEPEGEPREYAKMNNQFVIPVVEDGQVAALVILSLSLEVTAGSTESVYALEPKLRDGFLEVLFAHANAGGFAGTFTETANMDALRAALLEVAKKSLSERVSDVLITDIVRQDT
ncbi:MAG: flagellar basal body-associated FliL family protein [Pseudomonadota bacterium]|jgi:hypothetical protein